MNRKLLALFILLALTLGACAPAATSAPPSSPSNSGAPASDSYAGTTSGLAVSQPGDPGAALRMVIKNASLIIVVDNPGQAMTAISEMAVKMGGFVVSSNSFKITGESGGEVPQANVTVRVPVEKLDEALAQIRGLVKNAAEDIRKENVTGQDITKEYTDLQSRLTNLEATEKQLQRIQESATKTEDVLSVFRELTNVRQQIEVIKGQMKYYEESASLSAIDVQILAQAGIAPLSIGGWQPLGVAADALQILINLGKFLIDALIYLVIVFVPLGLVFYIPIRWIRRMMRRSAESRKAGPPPSKIDMPNLK
jgi:hypothetical protein